MKKRITAIILVIAMLATAAISGTMALFTDGDTISGNRVGTGKLDVEMYYTDDISGDTVNWINVETAPTEETAEGEEPVASAPIFNYQNWEPGYTDVKYIKIVNNGDYAFRYGLSITPTGSVGKVAEVIDVYYIAEPEGNIASRGELAALEPASTLDKLIDNAALAYQSMGVLLPAGEVDPDYPADEWHYGEIIVAVALRMQEDAGNEYQGQSVGDAFALELYATQYTYEEDDFGSDYDAAATFPELDIFPMTITVPVTVNEDGTLAEAVEIGGILGVGAALPAGVKLAAETEEVTLTISLLEDTTGNVTPGKDEEMRSFDVHIEGVAEDNTEPIIVDMGAILPVYLNQGNVAIYHVEDNGTNAMTQVDSLEELDAHNEFYYDLNTGELTVAMATFSPVLTKIDTSNPWNGVVADNFNSGTGTEADPYIIVNADQLAYMNDRVSNDNDNYGSKHYKLIADLNFGGSTNEHIWYPIGYRAAGEGTNQAGEELWYTYGGAFSGTFDGTGHTITGIYQNTWAMDGDYDNGYYNDAMGLFGYVYGGTVKNLTIDNFYSEGEFAPTGCVTAYAAGEAIFENIAITNSHPQTYNTGVAGIVGWDCGGDTEEDASKFTFKNITVDSSNTVSALWGSWDVAAAGLMGYLGEYSTADLTNCHVSATIDVYNDVCGNYQYYWYRYCGMLIGTVDKTDADGNLDLSNITATNCTVNFGDRHEYYYCEFEKNSQASYTEDYQFSRVDHSELNMTATPVTCNHEHTTNEDKQAVFIPFRQVFGGYGWGVDGVEMEEYNLDIDDTTPEKKITEGDEVSIEKFASAFPKLESGLSYVGNKNEIPVSKLFKVADGINVDAISDSGVYVTITSLYEELEVAGTFTPNTSDWTQGSIQFDEVGPVKVTIQDYDHCTPTVLYLEVVDATNVTTATSASGESVVLLNDISGGFTVSNGNTFYGNGFTVTCSGNGSYGSKALSYGFVTVKTGGVLDNVQVKCDIFPESYLYTSEMTADSDGRYPYSYSAVAVTGNSTISNCYIYGARNNIFVGGEGNVIIENTTTECGSLANIQIKSSDAYTVTLDDVTTIQNLTTSTYDSSKNVLGFGVLVGDNESTSNPTIKLTGTLTQYNWVTAADAEVVSNTYAKRAINAALDVEMYQHTNSNDEITVNMGIAYLNEKTATVEDDRTNKDSVVYEIGSISMLGYSGQVYSIKDGGDPDGSKGDYDPTTNTDILPTVSYTDSNDSITFESGYNTTEGRWLSTLTVDLDNIDGGSYDFSFDKLKVQKYGENLEFTVKDSDGNQVDKESVITLNVLSNNEYTLVVTDDIIFDSEGNLITYDSEGNLIPDEVETRELPFVLSATKTSIDPPEFANDGTATAIRLVESSGGDWRPAYDVLTGVSVTYWSASESAVKRVDLSTLYNSGTISSNVWTYTCDDYTLTITGGAVHSDGSVIAPVVADSKLYFASTNKTFTTDTTSRNIVLTYVFTDKNASTTWNRTETVTYSELTEYDYQSFQNGTLTQPSSSSDSGCVTPDALVTLADGTQKRIDEVTYADQLLVWDFFNGEYATVPASVIVFHGDADYEVLTLKFSDGTEVRTIGAHDFFDIEENEFVSIDAANVSSYVGDYYVKTDGESYTTVELIDYETATEYTGSYSLLSAYHNNFIVEGMFSLTPLMAIDTDNFCEWFEVGEGMKYDEEAMQADIEKYGLYTYEDFEDYLTYEQYVALNAPYYKVLVGKGEITFEELLTAISLYVD